MREMEEEGWGGKGEGLDEKGELGRYTPSYTKKEGQRMRVLRSFGLV